ncbi:hypothetical protein ACSMFQ_15510 [Ectopseudomonas chengduensis]
MLTIGTPFCAWVTAVLPPAAWSTASCAAVATMGLRNSTPATIRAMF